ncbi:MAG: hypothetical protein ABIS18_11675 [Actinomycetota bacterium]
MNLRRLDDKGISLVEIIVTVGLIALITTAFYGFLFSSHDAFRKGRKTLELNQASRLVLERLSRELREADAVVKVSSPDGSRWIEFQADFDASGSYTTSTSTGYNYVPGLNSDKEKVRYEYDAERDILLVSGWNQLLPPPEPIIEEATSFTFSYFGSDPYLDCGTIPPTCVSDGVITWQEIDGAADFGRLGFGNKNGVLDVELTHVTSIAIKMEVGAGNRKYTYRTGVELRNSSS